MITDIHSHFWEYPKHFTEDFKNQAIRARGDVEVDMTVRWDEYAATSAECGKSVVFGGKAKLSGIWVDDRFVAEYAAGHPDRIVGFLAVDPTQPVSRCSTGIPSPCRGRKFILALQFAFILLPPRPLRSVLMRRS